MINLIDVGASGDLPSPWKENSQKINHLLKFEPRDQSNGDDRVVSVNVALWETNGDRDFFIYKGLGGSGSSFFQQNYEYVRENFETLKRRGSEYLANTWYERSALDKIDRVPCRQLDDLLDELNHPFPYHFLKIDAQGAEYQILKGARKYLLNQCRGLHLELFTLPLYKDIQLLPDVVKYLEKFGFFLAKQFPAHGSFNSQHDCLFLKQGIDDPISRQICKVYGINFPFSTLSLIHQAFQPVKQKVADELAKNNREVAQKILLSFLQKNPSSYPALIQCSDLMLQDGNLNQAKVLLERASWMNLNPDELNSKWETLRKREHVIQDSGQRLLAFKNKHQGERCVIIGNGPSLNNMDLSFLKHETCFGMNRIYLGFEKWAFTPTYYVSVNTLVLEQSADSIQKIPCPKFLSHKGIPYFDTSDPDLYFINTVNFQKPFSDTPQMGLNEGYTVTYFALQIAYYMGFETVILIGVDHNFVTQGTANTEVISQGEDPNHFHPGYFGKGTRWHLPDLENSEKHYRLADHYYREQGRKIIDATLGGRCTIFQKQDYRQIFFSKSGALETHVSSPKSSKSSVTIFTTTKPFQGHSGMIQRNAIQSWLSLQPKPEVILLGKEEGVEEISRELGLRYVPDIDRNEYGTPTISGLFNAAQHLAPSNVLIYTNADIIFLSDLIPAIEKVSAQFQEFLIVGQRRNFDIPGLINFPNSNWESGLKKLVLEKEDLHPDCAIDYFIFTKNLWSEIPPFAVGRAAWDIAMVYRALAAGHPVIDATSTILAIHQNHDYGHLSGGQTQAWKGLEAQRNHLLAGGAFPKGMGYSGIGYISDATWKLTPSGLVKNTPRIVVAPTQTQQAEAQTPSTPKTVTSDTPEQTISACYEALKTQPTSAETYKTLGNALQAQGKFKPAIRAYIKAVELNPNFAEAHANVGNMAYLQGQLDEALTCYQKAIQLNPKLAGVYTNMSQVLQKQGRSYEAEFYQRKASELTNSDSNFS